MTAEESKIETLRLIREKALKELRLHLAQAEGLLDQATSVPLPDQVFENASIADIADTIVSNVMFELTWRYKKRSNTDLQEYGSQVLRSFK